MGSQAAVAIATFAAIPPQKQRLLNPRRRQPHIIRADGGGPPLEPTTTIATHGTRIASHRCLAAPIHRQPLLP